MIQDSKTIAFDCMAWAVFASAVLAAALGLTGCSFHVGFDYNGKTGIDNRTQTQLVRDGDQAPRDRKY
jgi:hypothetical protein